MLRVIVCIAVLVAGPALIGCGQGDCVPGDCPRDAYPSMYPFPVTTFVVGQQTDVAVRVYHSEESANIRFTIEDSTVMNLATRSDLIPQEPINNTASAIFRWTPMQSDIGGHQVKFRAFDPHERSTAQRLYMTVNAR